MREKVRITSERSRYDDFKAKRVTDRGGEEIDSSQVDYCRYCLPIQSLQSRPPTTSSSDAVALPQSATSSYLTVRA